MACHFVGVAWPAILLMTSCSPVVVDAHPDFVWRLRVLQPQWLLFHMVLTEWCSSVLWLFTHLVLTTSCSSAGVLAHPDSVGDFVLFGCCVAPHPDCVGDFVLLSRCGCTFMLHRRHRGLQLLWLLIQLESATSCSSAASVAHVHIGPRF